MQQQQHLHPAPHMSSAHSGSSASRADAGSVSVSSCSSLTLASSEHRFLHCPLAAVPGSPASASPVRRVGVKRRLTFDISSGSSGSRGSSASTPLSHDGNGILASLQRATPQQLQQLASASRVLPVFAPFTAAAHSRPAASRSSLRVATDSRSPGPSARLRQLDSAALHAATSPVLSSSPPSFIASLSPSMSPPLPALPRHSLLPPVAASPAPLSPHLLPVPDFSLHDVNVRQSPMRLSSALPVCPQTPTRSKRKRKGEDELLTAALTLFHAGSSTRRERSAEDEEQQQEEEAQAAAYHSSDSTVSDDDRADAASLTSPHSSPLAAPFAPFSLSLLSALLLSSPPASPPAASSPCPFPDPTRCSDFVYEEKIGQGSFSEVWRVRRKARAGGAEEAAREETAASGANLSGDEDDRRYAISRSLKPVRCSKQHDRLLRHGAQLRLLFSACPPHVLRHHCVWLEQSCVFRLTDFHPLGDLVSFFQQPRAERCLWRLLLHVGQALHRLSQLQLLHFDVKPSNILVSAAAAPACAASDCGFDFWLADLGTMIALSDWGSGHDDADEGDGQYLAPEVLTAAALTSGVDVYALGCTVYACITGRVLQRGDGGDGLTFDDEETQTSGVMGAVSAELRGVLMAMTEARLDRRMGLDELISTAARQLQLDG